MTALIWAAYHGRADTIKLLLEAGADIEAKTTVSKRELELELEIK